MTKYILFIALLIFISCNSEGGKESIKPRVTDVTELVYASVLVKPRLSYFPQPERSGIIREIFVDEGEIVEAGQLLANISASAEITDRITTTEINLQEARDNFQGENSKLKNIDLEMKIMREQFLLDSLNYVRQKSLWAQNIGKKIDLDKAELSYNVSKNKVNILKKEKAQAIKELENRYKKAVSAAKAERTQLDYFALRSNMKGIVYALNKKEGELISTQEWFAEIGSTDDFVVEMDIDEEDVTKIEIGDTVAITLNAYAREVFTAVVSKVYPKKDETTQTFLVESIFIKPPPRLYNGLSGEANIIVNKKENALVIPSDYLMAGSKVLTNEGERSVITGIKNMEFVEIISGIDTASLLLKPKE
jgi:multidrug efflux pump subunit AcrA (membrane-fusion protein)